MRKSDEEKKKRRYIQKRREVFPGLWAHSASVDTCAWTPCVREPEASEVRYQRSQVGAATRAIGNQTHATAGRHNTQVKQMQLML
jgi:hypothetical protein